MIGLGSNRLSVCRRGGMSVTQAGRGGMEWLGVRYPSWASPYSAQATAYLKENYGSYWSAIQQFGFNNPTMVPYINEDPDVICSVVNVGKKRYVESFGSQYFLIDMDFSTPVSLIECGFLAKSGTPAPYGTWENTSAAKAIAFDTYGGGRIFLNSGEIYLNAGITTNTYYLLEYKNGKVYINGNYVKDVTSNTSTRTKMGVFCTLIGTNPNYFMNPERVYRLHMVAANEIDLVPFIHDDNGTKKNGMLDLVSGTFYQNAGSGSFTISETPAP